MWVPHDEPAAGRGTDDETVVVVAPTGQDGDLARRVLGTAGFQIRVCTSLEDTCRLDVSALGALLIAAEAFGAGALERLGAFLAAQPAWSDLPVVVLMPAGKGVMAPVFEFHLRRLGNVSLLDRPLKIPTLEFTLRSALRGRRRQYQVRDFLTERERMEARLRDGQRLESLGVLAGGIAHDFNNLLTPILGYAQLIAENPLRPENADYGAEIASAAEHAARLTEQMLAYAGKSRIVPETVDLSSVVASILRLLKGSIGPRIEVETDLRSALSPVLADPTQLQQVVMNLVLNSVEAMPDGGCLRVSTAERAISAREASAMRIPTTAGQHVVLTVSDTGTGMDGSTLARIFDPFFSTKFTGRGLGLSAVYGIVRRHNGGLAVSSTPGRGTVFSVFLPATAGALAPTLPVPRMQAGRGVGVRVLVVDDEPAVLRLVSSVLSNEGYEVLTASDGAAAVDVLAGAPDVAVVLLDATMPKLGGAESIPRLKQVRPGVRIVVMSGYGVQEAAARHQDPAVIEHLSKPFSAGALVEVIHRTMKHQE